MRCWRWWSSVTPWWRSSMSRGCGRRRRTRTWSLLCSPKASISTGLKRREIIAHQVPGKCLRRSLPLMVISDQDPLLNTYSSECVKTPPTHAKTLRLPLTLKRSATFTYPKPKGSPKLITLQFCLLSLSLRGVHSQLYHPSLQVDPLKKKGGLWKNV